MTTLERVKQNRKTIAERAGHDMTQYKTLRYRHDIMAWKSVCKKCGMDIYIRPPYEVKRDITSTCKGAQKP